MRFKCKKHNVKCSTACANSIGTGCMNSNYLNGEEDIENEDLD